MTSNWQGFQSHSLTTYSWITQKTKNINIDPPPNTLLCTVYRLQSKPKNIGNKRRLKNRFLALIIFYGQRVYKKILCLRNIAAWKKDDTEVPMFIGIPWWKQKLIHRRPWVWDKREMFLPWANLELDSLINMEFL